MTKDEVNQDPIDVDDVERMPPMEMFPFATLMRASHPNDQDGAHSFTKNPEDESVANQKGGKINSLIDLFPLHVSL